MLQPMVVDDSVLPALRSYVSMQRTVDRLQIMGKLGEDAPGVYGSLMQARCPGSRGSP